jgi:ABC-type uncharacterized transport system substrate-binding protein
MSAAKWLLVIPACALLASIGVHPFVATASAAAKKCLFVSSYHRGYDWSDGVERGLRAVLEGKCEIRQFDMDAKRRKSREENVQSALEAKAIIESWQPDIVIAADDNAAKYLIKPYYKDHKLPFVFCGVNWTAKEYGFPYTNVTGMIEVAPIIPMLEHAIDFVPNLRRAFYIGAATLTEEKNLERFKQASKQLGFALEWALVDTNEKWLQAYARAQETDLVIVGSNAGINDWNAERTQKSVVGMTRKLSVTNHEWMMPFTMAGVTKLPDEHGEWAGKAALAILGGVAPSAIPIVPNNRRDIWINPKIIEAANVTLPDSMMRKAKKVVQLEATP